jgi:hypothetical protein
MEEDFAKNLKRQARDCHIDIVMHKPKGLKNMDGVKFV